MNGPLEDIASDLPYGIRDQVIGYAMSVDAALDDIAGELRVKLTEEQARSIVFLCGVKKLNSLLTGIYWSLERSISILEENEIQFIRIAGEKYSRRSAIFHKLARLNAEMQETLRKFGIGNIESWSPRRVTEFVLGDERRSTDDQH